MIKCAVQIAEENADVNQQLPPLRRPQLRPLLKHRSMKLV
jgi:hypothetical protein